MTTYTLDQAWVGEKQRLDTLAALHDPMTIRQLNRLDVKEGWRCAEVGAGAGSIARWLARRVGPAGKVVATDLDTRFLDTLNDPALLVRRHDIVTEPLEQASYDLVHARLLLMHVGDRGRAIQHMLQALRPGGWLLLEDADFRNYQVSHPPSDALRSTGEALVRLMRDNGADPSYGQALYSALSEFGLTTIGTEAQQIVVPLGTPLIAAFTLFLAQLRDKLVDRGLSTTETITRAITELESSSPAVVYGPILVSVWGRAPLPHGDDYEDWSRLARDSETRR